MCNLIVSYRTIPPFAFEEACTEGTFEQIKGHASLPSVYQFGFIKHHLDPFMPMLLDININPETIKLASFSDSTHLTYITKLSSWMLLITGHLQENIQYRKPQLQHYNFGWQTLNLISSAMPQKGFTWLSSTGSQHNTYGTCQRKYYSVAS